MKRKRRHEEGERQGEPARAATWEGGAFRVRMPPLSVEVLHDASLSRVWECGFTAVLACLTPKPEDSCRSSTFKNSYYFLLKLCFSQFVLCLLPETSSRFLVGTFHSVFRFSLRSRNSSPLFRFLCSIPANFLRLLSSRVVFN